MLPKEVIRHLEDQWHHEGWEKQLQAMAGIIALEALDMFERQRMIQIATRVAEGEVQWADAIVAIENRDPVILDEKTGIRLVRALLKHYRTKKEVPRQASSQ